MATFRSILSRWAFAVAIFFISFAPMSTAFALLSSSFQGPVVPVGFSLFADPEIISSPIEANLLFRGDTVAKHLGERVLTHWAISTSA